VVVDQVNKANNIAKDLFNEICTNKSSEYESLIQSGNFIPKFKVLLLKVMFFF